MDSAKKAVGSIKPEHLNEIRALKMPPDPIHDVLNGVLRLMGNFDNSWTSMKKFRAQKRASLYELSKKQTQRKKLFLNTARGRQKEFIQRDGPFLYLGSV